MINKIKQITLANTRTILLSLAFLPLFFLFSCVDAQKKQPDLVEIKDQQPQQELGNLDESFIDFRKLATADLNKKKTKVALLLPMSGKNKDLGKVLYNSAVMSLFDNDLQNNVELVLFDTKSLPESAESAISEISAQGIKLIIGPVFSNELEAIKDDIARNNLTAISLSNNQKFVDEKGIFLSGFFPEQQIERAIQYAIAQNKPNFAAILPNNIYGKAFSDLIRQSVKSKDGIFITSDFYQLSGANLDKTVGRVIKSYLISSELAQKIKNKEVPADFQISEADKIRPEIILIPEGGKQLTNIAALIKDLNKEERGFQLVGSSQWDNIVNLSDKNLEGAWIASPKNDRFRSFEESYYQIHSEFPPRISSIIYDLVAAVIEVNTANSGKDLTYADFVYHKNAKNGFEGIDGLFRFLPNGLVQRNLAMLKIQDGKLVVIDEAPEAFLSPITDN